MEATILGSAAADGVPAPLCDCEYCATSDRRRRPALAVEDGGATLVFDVGPDVTEQLHGAGITRVDAFFVTHAHYDHLYGLPELNHAAHDVESLLLNGDEFDHPFEGREIRLYGSDATRDHAADAFGYVLPNVDYAVFEPGDSVDVGGLTVTAFAVEHGGEAFPTQGYAVTDGDATVAYAPDAASLGRPAAYVGADLLFVEGSIFGAEIHAPAERIRAEIDRAGADRAVLTNASEHLHQRSTAAIEAAADEMGYEVWPDFRSWTV